MANVSLFNMKGEKIGEVELSDALFGTEINEHLVKMAVTAHLAAMRQGTQKAKTRGEVSGGGKKPYRQKGTGHARQGSTRAPQWAHGGVVFAPVPRDYTFKINKKEKVAALKSVLTSRVAEEKIFVLDKLELAEAKTKNFAAVLDGLKLKKALVVIGAPDQNLRLASRNVPNVKMIDFTQVNVYDVLKYDAFVATEEAVRKLEEVYA